MSIGQHTPSMPSGERLFTWVFGCLMRISTQSFRYPEVVHNHFQNRHSVDDHNAKRHSPISIEVVWATK